MTWATFGLILFSVSLSALAQISFKAGILGAWSHPVGPGGVAAELTNSIFTPGVMVGLALYGLGTLLWLTALSHVGGSQAYPFVGIGFLLTAVLGDVFFGEPLSAQKIAGIMLVIGGVCLVAQC